MTTIKHRTPGMLAAMALILATTAIPAANATTTEDASARRQEHAQKLEAHMKARLEKMAARLEIRASQQPAWNDYVKARELMTSGRPARPGPDADAATIARSRAELAAAMAQKLALVSEATAKLQAVLDDNQQKTLNQMTRRGSHRGHHGQHAKGAAHERHGEHGQHGQHERAPR